MTDINCYYVVFDTSHGPACIQVWAADAVAAQVAALKIVPCISAVHDARGWHPARLSR